MSLAEKHKAMRERWIALEWAKANRKLTKRELEEQAALAEQLNKLRHYGRPAPKCKECGR